MTAEAVVTEGTFVDVSDFDVPLWRVDESPATKPEALGLKAPSAAELVRLIVEEELELPGSQLFELAGFEDGLAVRLGDDTALVRRIATEAGGYFHAEVVPWVAFRSRRVTLHRVDENGNIRPTDDETFDVCVIHQRYGVEVLERLTASQSASVKYLAEHSRLGLAVPKTRDDVARVNAMLTAFGARDVTEYVNRMAAAGWMRDPRHGGKAVFLAPAGSVTASGVSRDYEVVEPPKSEDEALPAAARDQGYDRIPEGDELREAAESLPAFLGMFEQNPALGLLLLSQEFVAPLALPRRFTVWIKGPRDSGKSQAMSAAQSFSSGVGMDGASFHGSLITASAAFIDSICIWNRHGVLYFDDAKLEDTDKNTNQSRNTIWDEMLRAIYTGQSRAKGLQNGGIRAQHMFSSAAVVSAEVPPPAGSAFSRAIEVPFRRGDVDLDGAENRFDAFRTRFGDTGLARALKAAYLQWLAAEIDEHGWEQYRRASRDLRSSLVAERSADSDEGRSYELISIAEAGLEKLRAFLAVHGLDDRLPAHEEVRRHLLSVRAQTVEASKEASPARQIIEAIENRIRGYAMHVKGMTDDGAPDESARLAAYGWAFPDEGAEHRRPMGAEAGKLSADGKVVLVPSEVIRAVAASLGFSDSKEQRREWLRPLVVDGSRPGEEAPRKYGFGRSKGFLLDAQLLGLPGSTGESHQRKLGLMTDDEPF